MREKRCTWLILLATPVLLGLCLLMGASKLGLPSDNAILYLRLYRVMAGFVVGAALACAGVVLQALLRNPLAEPYVLGVSSGAGLGAAIAIMTGIGALTIVLPVSAFVCAALALSAVYSLAITGGKLSIYGLILSGVIVSSLCSSLLMFIVALSPASGLHSIIWWMLGNLEMYSRPLLAVCSVSIVSGSLAAWALAPELNALALGQDMAHHVGVRTKLAITLGLALATLITATAVALAGLIGFVGLIVPHVVRSMVGPDHRRLIPVAALAGGVFLAVCDAVARTILAPVEIPVGVITALIGGPFFLVILRSRRKRVWIE
jgi:iron complex transport system permease protein